MRAPFASRFASLYALGATGLAVVAVYRAAPYLLPASAWVLSLALALVGLSAPLVLGGLLRDALLTGKLPLALIVPVIGLVVGPRLVPSPLTIGPLLLCAGALAGTCAVACVNVRHRRRRLRRALEPGDAESFVRMYLEAGTVAQAAADWRALRRALRAQAWLSTPPRRARAAAQLRHTAAAIGTHERVRIPPELRPLTRLAEACAASPDRIHTRLLSAAEKLECGGRIVRWRSWLWSLVAPGLDAERDWVEATDLLARRHRIERPPWFRGYRRALAHAPLTTRDVAPLQGFRPALAKPVAAGIAVLVGASVLLSTATAQTPLDDARPLPVLAGPRAASHVEPLLSRALSSLAGHRAEARCWAQADWRRLSAQRSAWPRHERPLGRWSAYASPAHDQAHFSATLCGLLSRLAYQRIPVRSDEWPAALAFSVATLAHEAQHLRGIFNEAKAECYGMQSITAAAVALGRTHEEGRYLSELYWRYQYHDERRDPAYVSDDCRDGGGLDLRPYSNVWP